MSLLLVADHASNVVPDSIELNIPAAWFGEHIAVDLGSAALTLALQADFGCRAVLAEVSRLVVDVNREPERADLIPEYSDGRVIAGNVGLPDNDRRHRVERYFTPYHAAIEAAVAARRPSLIVSIHSFTPQLASRSDAARPWPIGILYNRDARAAVLGIAYLREQGFDAGDNEPYSGRDLNYTMNRHAEATDIKYLGFEVRQDLLADVAGIARWSKVLSGCIRHVARALALNLRDIA